MQKITIMQGEGSDGADWYFDGVVGENIVILDDSGRYGSQATIGKENDWYQKALDTIPVINDIENYSYSEDDWQGSMDNVLVIDGWVYDIEDYARDTGLSIENAKRFAQDVINFGEFEDDDTQTIVNVLNAIYGSKYWFSAIRGYSQGDYANVIYNKEFINKDTLNDIESFYFGGYYDIHVEDTDGENYWSYMPSYPAKLEDLEEWADVKVTPDTISIDEAGSGLGQNEDMEDMWDESEDRLDRTTYDPRRWGNEYDLDTISKINESRRLRRSKRVMSSSRLHPSLRRSVKASRSVRRGRI